MGRREGSKKPTFTRLASNAFDTTATTVPSLFQNPVVKPAVHHKFNFIWTLSFLLFAVGAVVAILVISFRHERPSVLHTYTSSNSTGGNGYQCGCSLPSALQSPSQQATVANPTGLKSCYDKTELRNVTLLQFNTATAPDIPNLIEKMNMAPPHVYHAQNLTSGYTVVQAPKELNLWNGDPNGTLWDICHAIPYTDTIFNFSLNGSQLPIYFDYPQSYMRFVLEYDCSNCSNCSPDQILHPLNNSKPWMNIFDWVECSGYSVGVSKETPCNKSTNAYHGRCTVYPIFDISMSKRLKLFLTTLENIPSLKITTQSPDDASQPGIEMHANSLYYNQSMVTNNGRVTYGFIEVERGSAVWLSLVQNHTNLASGNCTLVDQNNRTEICTGTAICNVFKQLGDNGVSTPSVSCMDFRDNYPKCVLSANTSGNMDILEDLCGKNPGSAHGNNSLMTCTSVPAHTISYKGFQSSVNESELDYKFFTSTMRKKWNSTYVSGVCANVYEDRVRYTPHGGQLYLLETNCSDKDLCHLTGRYNLPNDTSPPGTTGTGNLVDLTYTTPQYKCWKVAPQPWITWTINLVGVLGGWLSTLYAVANILYGKALTMYSIWCNLPPKESSEEIPLPDVENIPGSTDSE